MSLSRFLNEQEMAMVREAGYGENGLRYRLEELNTILPTDMSLEEVAQYADAVTFAKVARNEAAFFLPSLEPIPAGKEVKLTLTGLGNIAHVALNIKNDEARTKALALYHQLRASPMEVVNQAPVAMMANS